MTERRECPVLRMSDEELKEDFFYFPPSGVTPLLESFGYGSTKRLIDALYAEPVTRLGVGILLVTEERCKDHFGVLRGVDMVEAVTQTLLAANFMGRGIEAGSKPIFQRIEGMDFYFPATIGATLNVVVDTLEDEGDIVRGYGWVLRGRSVLAEGIVQGRIRLEREFNVGIRRAGQLQAREMPLFGLR